jgi:hypothetical protein
VVLNIIAQTAQTAPIFQRAGKFSSPYCIRLAGGYIYIILINKYI